MNGRKAKRLRQEAYGDYSLKDRRYRKDNNGTVRCIGRRRVYQTLKRNK